MLKVQVDIAYGEGISSAEKENIVALLSGQLKFDEFQFNAMNANRIAKFMQGNQEDELIVKKKILEYVEAEIN